MAKDTDTDDRAIVASDGEIIATPPSWMRHLPVVLNAEELMARTIERAMNAQTAEELLASPDSEGLRDYSGDIIELRGVVGIMPSKIKTGDYYLIFEAAVGSAHKVVTMTTGSPFAASRIIKLAAEGWLPRRVRVVQQESSTNPGQASLWVVDAEPTVKESEDGEAF